MRSCPDTEIDPMSLCALFIPKQPMGAQEMSCPIFPPNTLKIFKSEFWTELSSWESTKEIG